MEVQVKEQRYETQLGRNGRELVREQDKENWLFIAPSALT
jgi:hypothetical protein